jgi:hypothetical protein
MSPAERFEALEVMRQPLHFILDALAGHYLMDSLPLAEREQMIARLRLDLMIKNIVGYKVILDQLHDQSLTGYLLHKNTRSAALHRVLFYLGYILLHSYQLRRDAPSFVWREMHGIHHYAVANDLHTGNAKVDPADGHEKLSVDDLYKQNLLLAMSAPHGLLRSEVGKVYSMLKTWAPKAELHSFGDKVLADHYFLVDIQTDIAPSCCGNYPKSEEIQQGWVLAVDKLLQLLKEELAVDGDNAPLHTGPGMLSRGLLLKLYQVWSRGVKRTSRRLSISGQVVVVCGLDGLYSLLGGDRLPAADAPASAEFKMDLPGDNDLDPHVPLDYEKDEVIEELHQSFYGNGDKDVEPVVSVDGEGHDKIYIEACAILNQSMNGYHLRYSGAGHNLLRVGGLLGINNASSGPRDKGWGFGVVRWIKTLKPQLMEFGVELLPGEFEPVMVQCRRGGSNRTDSWSGFLQHLEDDVVNLIVSPLHIEEEDQVVLIDAGAEQRITLHDQLEMTDTFAQYSFSHMSVPVAETKEDSFIDSDDDGDGVAAEFDSIWESLR